MARAALGRALFASGGTILAIGGATMLVSTVSMGVARAVVMEKKKKLAVSCEVCKGRAKLTCDVCGGERAVKFHPFNTLALHARTPYCVCAMCAGAGDQACLNCLGEGVTYPS
ncbi:MAG: hypothetical protein J3K34DRAFT_413847 [Monoraphidium minutum]|nr:MAG: hypothetical protein J3K34DRAFT_413847 [Monoraphidium minutum]